MDLRVAITPKLRPQIIDCNKQHIGSRLGEAVRTQQQQDNLSSDQGQSGCREKHVSILGQRTLTGIRSLFTGNVISCYNMLI